MKRRHPASPPGASWPWIGAATGCWLAIVLVDLGLVGVLAAAVVTLALVISKHPVIASVVVVASLSGVVAFKETPPLTEGPIAVSGSLMSEIRDGQYGSWALLDTDAGPVLLDLDDRPSARRGDLVVVSGEAVARPGVVSGISHRGVIRVDDVALISESASPIHRAGNAVRGRVIDRLDPLVEGRALLAGFLVGDTSGLSEIDIVAMRRAGISHFTAVSGSNVALFLGLLFVLSGPMAMGPKRRALVGLLGLPIYAAATGFEPSVMRASIMAAVLLAGRLFGFVLEAWQLLSAAVVVLLIFSPELVWSAGLQLSVVATAGVLVGARWPIPGGRLARALAVTVGAQVAVAPLLILHFEVVPLLSPVVNVIAAPVVAASTLLGAIGVIGLDPALDLGVWLAGLVLSLSRGAAGWPQLEWPWLVAVLGGLGLAIRWPSLRVVVVVLTTAAVLILVLRPSVGVPEPGLVVFDVGQGDSILVSGGEGRFLLVDGGPDPVLLLDKLAAYGVEGLDVAVLTHVHADHATGLTGLVGRVPIGQVWANTEPHITGASTDLFDTLGDYGIPLVKPSIGQFLQLGQARVTVMGPLRRYASPNDQSIVLMIEGPGRTAILTGDIEVVAQGDLDGIRADVLKVPHQGGATSDPEWLESVGAELSVISVGPNDFGHPSLWVIEVLENAGSTVVRTDLEGDVVVPLG